MTLDKLLVSVNLSFLLLSYFYRIFKRIKEIIHVKHLSQSRHSVRAVNGNTTTVIVIAVVLIPPPALFLWGEDQY